MGFKITDTGELHPESGRRVSNYEQTPPDESKLAVYTGPWARGTYTAVDGTEYNVSDDFVEMPADHFGEISHKLGIEYEDLGHPVHKQRGYTAAHKGELDYDPLVDEYQHICSSHCGSLQRTADEHVSQFNSRLSRLGMGDHVGRAADPEMHKPSHDEFVARVTRQYAHVNGEDA